MKEIIKPNRFKIEMTRQNISTTVMAAIAGVSKVTVNNWKRGGAIHQKSLAKVAGKLGITIEELISDYDIVTK